MEWGYKMKKWNCVVFKDDELQVMSKNARIGKVILFKIETRYHINDVALTVKQATELRDYLNKLLEVK